VYGTVYSIPLEIGPVDVSIFGSILLHIRDPFLALQNAAVLTRETMIVTDIVPRIFYFPFPPLWWTQNARMRFVPDPRTGRPWDTWWRLPPDLVRRFLGVLGFEEARVTYHWQFCDNRRRRLFTVKARRTRGAALEPA